MIEREYRYSTVEFDDSSDIPKFIAYCDSDCAEEIEFIPYDESDDPAYDDLGEMVIWFTKGYVYKLRLDDEDMYERFERQPGYVYRDIGFGTFTEIVSDEESIGSAANFLVIQPLRDQNTGVIWRDYLE